MSWLRQIYLSWSYVFRRRLEDVFIKTNIFVFAIRLQEVIKTFSRRLQDVFNTSCQDVCNNSSRRLAETSSRHLQEIFKFFCTRRQDIFKTSWKDVFKTFPRRIIRLNCLYRWSICLAQSSEKFMVTVENLQVW